MTHISKRSYCKSVPLVYTLLFPAAGHVSREHFPKWLIWCSCSSCTQAEFPRFARHEILSLPLCPCSGIAESTSHRWYVMTSKCCEFRSTLLEFVSSLSLRNCPVEVLFHQDIRFGSHVKFHSNDSVVHLNIFMFFAFRVVYTVNQQLINPVFGIIAVLFTVVFCPTGFLESVA